MRLETMSFFLVPQKILKKTTMGFLVINFAVLA